MSKRTWITVIALVASLLIAATGTLAYLTDTDSDVNVMTLGNVDIEQIELQRTEDFIKNDGHTGLLEEGDLEPFVDGKPLYPAYPVNNQGSDYTAEPSELLYWGPYVTAESDGTKAGAGNGLWNDDKLVGAVDKMVFVQNTGSSPAYYRTLIAFECPEGVEYSEGSDKQLMMNINGNSRFQWEELDYVTLPDGQRYLVMCATYQNALESGEISRPSLLQVVMTHNATSETVAAMGKTYEILALSQAVQVENLEKQGAEKALDAAFGDCTEENLTLWFSEMEGMPVQTASTAEELAAALAEGGTVVVTGDIELADEQITLTEDTNLVLSGNITADPGTLSSTYGMFNIPSGVTLTVGGEGSIVLDTETSKGISAVIFQNDGDLVINSGNYLAVCNNSASASIVAVVDNVPNSTDSSVTINGGTLAVAGTRAPNIIRCWPLASGADTYLTINGGTFKANPDRTSTYIWSKNDTRWDKDPVSHSYVTINGGTFEDILLEVDGFVADHDIDSSVTGITMVEGVINGYVDASGNKI